MSFHLTGGIFWLITQTVFAVVIDDIRLQHSPPGACNVWVYVCVCVCVCLWVCSHQHQLNVCLGCVNVTALLKMQFNLCVCEYE